MSSHAGHFVAGDPRPPLRDGASDYRRLLAVLAARARRLGSRDPEGAAQEALKRSLESSRSQPAIEYYFSDTLPEDAAEPDWPLDQLFAWLHGVVHYVVREEHRRTRTTREISFAPAPPYEPNFLDPADPSPDQLDLLIRKEMHAIVLDCFPKLDREYRAVLTMRADGLKYSEIAFQLGVNENTVATWVSRGMQALTQRVKRRVTQLRSAV